MSSETISVNKDPKFDDVETNQNDAESGDESSDNEGCEHMTEEEIIEYRRYSKQLGESNGFDVDFAPTAFRRSIGGGPILPRNLNEPEAMDRAKKCTQYVIEQYNKLMKGKSRLRLVQIPKANWTVPGYMYNLWITFDAEDNVSTHSDTYQTLICHYHYQENIYVLTLRKKGEKEDMRFTLDLDDQEESVWMNKRAAFAISIYNEYEEKYSKEKQREYSALEFVKVVKAVRDMNTAHTMYWTTLEAKDTKSGQVNSYLAEMVYDVHNEKMGINGDIILETER